MRPAYRLIAALAVVGSMGCASAATPADEPLEPEQAFPATARVVKAAGRERVHVSFRIADGYYLYRDRFKVAADGLALGKPSLPPGVAKNDPFVGRSRIFRRGVTLRIPFAGPPKPGHYVVKVTAQGCAEERLCYAPFTQDVALRIP